VLGEAVALDLERRLADIDACDNALEFQALCADDLVELSGTGGHFISRMDAAWSWSPGTRGPG
jgi:hypothetical protein